MSADNKNQMDISLSFQELLDSYGKMEKIVKNIQGFTSQTNILSFNSAIESARIGEEGKGFAVIATQIKDLAGKSAESNEQSFEVLSTIRQKVNEVFAVRMADIAFDTIDKIDRNLFERNCDVQAWATFDKVVEATESNEDSSKKEASKLLKNLVDIYEVYYDVFITDLSGTIISSGSYPRIIGSDVSKEDWFKEVKETKKHTVNDMQFLDFVGDYTVGYNCPIIGKNNEMTGILSTRFNWSFIYDIIDKARISSTGDLLLVNSSGMVIGSKNRRDVFSRKVDNIPAVKKAIGGEFYGYDIVTEKSGKIQIIGYAHTMGYNAYKGKKWSVIAIEEMSRK